MTKKTLAALIILLQMLPLTAQYNWQDTGDSADHIFTNTNDTTPRQRLSGGGGCGNGVYGYQGTSYLPDVEPPRLLRALPYPSGDSITIEYELEDPAVIRFQMVGEQGKVVYETPYTATKAFRQKETWTTANIVPGIYLLIIQLDGRKLAQCTVTIP